MLWATRISSIAAATTALLAVLPAVLATPGAKTLHHTFVKRYLGPSEASAPRRLLKRQTVGSVIDNEQILYLINVTVGTPSQPFSLLVNTGSSDTWVPSAKLNTCLRAAGCQQGSYDAGASSTYAAVNFSSSFHNGYADGSEVFGDYFSDVVVLGDATLTGVTMAQATQSSSQFPIGVMGLGFRAGESSIDTREPFTYPNILNVLQDQGKIDSLLYSLWLDDSQSDRGSILFGGVDTDKYTGPLVTLPIQPSPDTKKITSFTINWTGLTITGSGNNINASPPSAQPIILSSGNTFTYLPNDSFQTIAAALGVQLYSDDLTYVVPCRVGSEDLTFAFEFGGSGGATINVPVSELVLPLQGRGDQPAMLQNQTVCAFGIVPSDTGYSYLGDTFLRSAYVVFDLDHNEIGLAQTKVDADPGPGNVQVISSGARISAVTSPTSTASVPSTSTSRPLTTTHASSASPSPTTSPGGGSAGGNGNVAGRPSVDNSAMAVVMVTLGTCFFGAILI